MTTELQAAADEIEKKVPKRISDAELWLHCQIIAASVMDNLTHDDIEYLEIAIYKLAKRYRGEL